MKFWMKIFINFWTNASLTRHLLYVFYFLSAVKLGTDMLELDCHLTKDEQVVVLHDSNLKRSTGINSYIADVAYAVSGETSNILYSHSQSKFFKPWLICSRRKTLMSINKCFNIKVSVCVCLLRNFHLTFVSLGWLSNEVSVQSR